MLARTTAPDSQRLLDPTQQRQLLDAFGRHDQVLTTVATRAADLKRLRDALGEAQSAGKPTEAEIELLQFQLQELDAIAPEPGEFEQLDQEQRRLANAEQLMRDAAAVIGLLVESDDGAAIERSGKARDVLSDLEAVDSAFSEARELVDSATIQLEDAARLVTRQLDRMELDPERLQIVDDRLTELHRLARKHDCQPDTLPELIHSGMSDGLTGCFCP